MSETYSLETKNRIFAAIMRDLKPTPAVANAKIATASLIGGGLSLLLCGQFGLGFTPHAHEFSSFIHSHVGSVPCMFVYGAFYAVFPLLILRFGLCTGIQFRALALNYRGTMATWIAGLGIFLAAIGHANNEAVFVLLWVFGATSVVMGLISLVKKLNDHLLRNHFIPAQ